MVGLCFVYLRLTYGFTCDKTSHTLLGNSLGFLLVFRSTLANQRFWDGRGSLGELLKSLRSYAMHIRAFVPDDVDQTFFIDAMRITNAMYYTTVMHLRKQRRIPGRVGREHQTGT